MVRLRVVLLSFLIFGWTSFALAKPEFFQVFKEKYNFKADGHLGSLQCAICHVGKPPIRNPYGKEIEAALDAASATELTPAILDTVGKQSALADGVKNEDKIAKDISPIEAMPAGAKPSTTAEASLIPTHFFHPAVVHFPIALVLVGLALEILAMWKQKELYAQAAILNYAFACVSYPVVIAAGVAAWIVRFHLSTDTTSIVHLALGLLGGVATVGLYLYRSRATTLLLKPNDIKFWVLALIAAVSLMVGGHFGSLLSGV